MSIEAFEMREQILQLRAKVLQAEQERLEGAERISISEARKRLRERYHIADTRTDDTKLFY